MYTLSWYIEAWNLYAAASCVINDLGDDFLPILHQAITWSDNSLFLTGH